MTFTRENLFLFLETYLQEIHVRTLDWNNAPDTDEARKKRFELFGESLAIYKIKNEIKRMYETEPVDQ